MSVNLCAVTCMSVIVPGQISGNALSQPKPGNRRRSWAVLAILGVGLVVAGAALHPWLQSFAQLRDYNRAEYVVTVDRDFLYGLNTADPGIKEELLSSDATSRHDEGYVRKVSDPAARRL